MNETGSHEAPFEASILDVLRTGLRITRGRPTLALRALRLLRRQRAAAKNRQTHALRGTHVPPFVIFSVTDRCNLDCAGCYAKLLHHRDRPEMSDQRVRRLLAEAVELGISVILLAGGEPLMRREVVESAIKRPEILFLLFTNGSLLDRSTIASLRQASHIVPVLSLEGSEEHTDGRRGQGTYRHVTAAMTALRESRTFFGASITLTQENFATVLSEGHLRGLIARGCQLFYFINYVPVEPGTDHLQLSPDQVLELEERLTRYRKRLPALFIAFPHDELAFGGCLAAGKGFLHINAYGDVEPCPFSPYSDVNLMNVGLEEALASPLFRRIRAEEKRLDERDGRCALWKERAWVASLLGVASESDDP